MLEAITETTPIGLHTANRRFSHSSGWRMDNAHYSQTNAQGLIHASNFNGKSIDLAGVGDSYMQAAQLKPGEHFTSLLSVSGLAHAAYAFGKPGAGVSDYLGVIAWIRQHYPAPRHFAVLISSGDIAESLICARGRTCFRRSSAGDLELITKPWQPSAAYPWLFQSHLLSYIVGNLRFKPARLLRQKVASGESEKSGSISPVRLAVFETFLAKLPAATGIAPSELVLIFDCDREAISQGIYDRKDPETMIFVEKAKASGFKVIDMQTEFVAHRKQSRAHFDFRPADGHWNALAHRVVANAVARELGLRKSADSNLPELVLH